MKIRVCVVCLGNICRSPTAAAVLRETAEAARAGHIFEIDSAGFSPGRVGHQAWAHSRAVALLHGTDLSKHRARLFTVEDFDRFDWILVCDRRNRDDVVALARNDSDIAKVLYLRIFDPEPGDDFELEDPYHTGRFDHVYNTCKRLAPWAIAWMLGGAASELP